MRGRLARLLPSVAACALLAACASGTVATPTTVPSAPATPGPPSLGPSPTATAPATAAPTATEPPPTATPTAVAATPMAPPAVETFWDTVLRGLESAGHLRLNVIGPTAGVLRYQPDASETVADGKVVFVCVKGAAFDGQSGSFVTVPGSWECGGGALVGGFRNTGQPVDAWNESLPADTSITETTAVEPDGRWRWDYAAQSPVFGGKVTTSVWVDPAGGRILDARRTDPTGTTRYGINYDETFPAIARP